MHKDEIELPATDSIAAPDESNWSLSTLNSTRADLPPSPNLPSPNNNYCNGGSQNPLNANSASSTANCVVGSDVGASSAAYDTWPVEPGELCPTHTEYRWPVCCDNDLSDVGVAKAGLADGENCVESGQLASGKHNSLSRVQGGPSSRTMDTEDEIGDVLNKTPKRNNGEVVC